MKKYMLNNKNGVLKTAFRSLCTMLMVIACNTVSAQQKDWMVRLAKIEIDTAYLDEYKAAIEEHTRAALASEPGVLTLYAMYEKEHPGRITVLEIYANKAAYQSHLKTPHFLRYKTGTLKMVKSLELIDVDPIAFGAKPDLLKRQK